MRPLRRWCEPCPARRRDKIFLASRRSRKRAIFRVCRLSPLGSEKIRFNHPKKEPEDKNFDEASREKGLSPGIEENSH